MTCSSSGLFLGQGRSCRRTGLLTRPDGSGDPSYANLFAAGVITLPLREPTMQDLPRPEVVRCFFEESFQPPLPAMVLRWDPDGPGVTERSWYLPDGVCIKGPAP